VQVPATQVSDSVQALPSLQGVPFVRTTCAQPVRGSQLSAVHGLLSSQEMAALAHDPPEHTPAATWHLSFVHATPSLSWQLPVALQAWHAPHELVEQQNPSTQLPVMHWLPEAQVSPFALSAQLRDAPAPWQV
jgi:hypothetical protein